MSYNFLRDQIEKKLEELLAEKQVPYHSLFSAARYSTLGGGKRLRPLLVLVTTQVLEGDIDTALVPACALEMVHTYSLIHDDLPAMDNDDFRRGKPTLHKVYPESHAILTGDFLLTNAFDLISHCPKIADTQKIALIQTLSRNSGGDGLIGGQVMDLEEIPESTTLDFLKKVYHQKTATLIEAAVLFGAILSKANDRETKALKAFSQEIGLAFQIVDDILDITSSVEKHGKSIGSDSTNKKTTSATLLGVQEAEEYASKLYQSALAHLSDVDKDTSLLEKLAEQMVYRKR